MPGSKRSLKKKIVKSRIFLPPTLEKTAGSPTLARRRRAVEESITRRFSYMPLLAVWMHFAPFNGPSRGGSRPRIKRIKQSSNQAIKQSNNQTINQSNNQTVKQSDNQTIKQSSNQTIRTACASKPSDGGPFRSFKILFDKGKTRETLYFSLKKI